MFRIPPCSARAALPGAIIALIVVALACLALILTACVPDAHADPAPPVHEGASVSLAPTCAEDAPCWTWSTMGNHRRGWVGTWGSPHVGGACRFARAVARGRVDGYPHLQRMRGDHIAFRRAILAGCVSRHALSHVLPVR